MPLLLSGYRHGSSEPKSSVVEMWTEVQNCTITINASSITYPFLDSTSPNFNSVPECRGVTLRYGSEEIRDEEVFRRH